MRLALIVVLWMCVPWAQAAGVGVFTDVTGDTRILRGEAWLAAAGGVEVSEDDIVETGKAASAQLDMNDGSVLKLGANTRVLLADYRLDANRNVITAGIDVLSGWLRFAVAKLRRPDSEYGINTPTMTVGIRGTEGVIEATNQRGGLHLETGEVALRATDAGSVPVRAGEFVERARGGAFTRPRAAPAEFRQRMPGTLHPRAVQRAHLLKQRGVAAREIRRLQPADRERLLREHPHQRQRLERRFQPPPGAGKPNPRALDRPGTKPRPAAAPGNPPRAPAAEERLRQERAIKQQKEKERLRKQREERKKRRDDDSHLDPAPDGTAAALA